MRGTLGAACALLALANPAFAQNQIGVAAAVNPDATGTPPGGARRVIQVGLDMQRNERVVTDAQGRTQMLFLDGSALTLGPNSDVTLDEFVYDPDSGRGKLALSASRGLFRLVGGKISKGAPVEIRTPTATIGLRGGIAVIEVGEATRAQFLFGDEMTIEAGGETQTLSRPGFEVTVVAGEAPSEPAPLNEQTVGESLGGLEGVSGSTGGAPQPPSDENVADTQITQLGSANAPQSIAPVTFASTENSPAPELLAQRVEQERVDSSQISATESVSQQSTTSFSYGGHYYSNVPFTSLDPSTFLTTRDTSRNIAYSGGRIQNGRFVAEIGGATIDLPALPGSFTFDAAGTTSPFGPVSGRGFVSPDGAFFHYVLTEASGNAASVFGGVPFIPTGPSGQVSAFTLSPGFGDHAIPFIPAEFGGNFGGASISPLYSANREPTDPPLPPDGRITAVFGAIAIEGQGASQRSAMTAYTGSTFFDSSLGKLVVGGYARGSSRMSSSSLILRHGTGGTSSPDAEGNSFFGLNGPDYFVLDSDTYPSNASSPRQSAAGIIQPFEDLSAASPYFQTQYAVRQDVPAGVGASRTSRTLNGYVGGVAEQRTGFVGDTPQFSRFAFGNTNGSPTDVEIITRADLNRVQASFSLTGVNEEMTLSVEFGDLSGGGSRSAFIDDNIFGMRESVSRPWIEDGAPSGAATGGLLTSAFFTNTSAVPANVTLCTCEHLVWGFWNADQRPMSGPERTRMHLALFVAGELPDVTSIPTTGAASYAGHVAANVDNAGLQYVAFGNYAQTWDFGSRSGSVTISNLDGATYTGSVSSNTGRDFSGSISGAGRAGALSGSFFSGGGDPVAAVGGSFFVAASGPTPYQAGGVIVGQRQ